MHHSFHAISGHNYLVSGSISPPKRGTFQLSLTVLVRYRSWDVFRIRSWCLPNSHTISNASYSRTIQRTQQKNIIYGTITLYGSTIPSQIQLIQPSPKKVKSITPHLPQITKRNSVCPTPLSLAVTHDIEKKFLSLPSPTKMFQFSEFPIHKKKWNNTQKEC